AQSAPVAAPGPESTQSRRSRSGWPRFSSRWARCWRRAAAERSCRQPRATRARARPWVGPRARPTLQREVKVRAGLRDDNENYMMMFKPMSKLESALDRAFKHCEDKGCEAKEKTKEEEIAYSGSPLGARPGGSANAVAIRILEARARKLPCPFAAGAGRWWRIPFFTQRIQKHAADKKAYRPHGTDNPRIHGALTRSSPEA
ncbi:unnamed protein product, partial [Prorocentrum cordatum]